MPFNDRLMNTGFWSLNAGLVLMIFTSLLPVGLFQFQASTSVGMWYARSDEFLQQPFLETLRWIRTFGDVVFIVGALAVDWQVVILGLLRRRAQASQPVDRQPPPSLHDGFRDHRNARGTAYKGRKCGVEGKRSESREEH